MYSVINSSACVRLSARGLSFCLLTSLLEVFIFFEHSGCSVAAWPGPPGCTAAPLPFCAICSFLCFLPCNYTCHSKMSFCLCVCVCVCVFLSQQSDEAYLCCWPLHFWPSPFLNILWVPPQHTQKHQHKWHEATCFEQSHTNTKCESHWFILQLVSHLSSVFARKAWWRLKAERVYRVRTSVLCASPRTVFFWSITYHPRRM